MTKEKDSDLSGPCTRREFFSRSKTLTIQAASSFWNAVSPLNEDSSQKTFSAKIKPGSWIRPPGSLKEEKFLNACTRCGDCLKACPPLVLRPLGPEWGDRLEGTPSLFPKEGPCLMCEGFPCIASCPEGALLMPQDGMIPRLGRAVVNESVCVLKDEQPCRECEKSCPTAYSAIRADGIVKRAIVDDKTCIGCGLCVQICPVQAIEIRAAE